MPIRLSAFGRRFSPSWPLTLLTLLLLGVFASLGQWQWQRGVAKQASWDEFGRSTAAARVGQSGFERAARFARVALSGHFDAQHQFLLDNRSHAGRPGYEVLTPFVLDTGGRVLVNRGWVPYTGYRDQLPDVSMRDLQSISISGRIEELPAAGLSSGRAAPAAGAAWPKLTSFPTHDELERALGEELAPRTLLLDPGIPDGYVREWSPPGLSPSRHFSYAIQWWGFAVLLLVIYFGLNFRKVS